MNSKWLCHQCRLPGTNRSKRASDFCLFKSHSFSLLCFSLIYLAVGFVDFFLFFAVFIARFPFRLLSALCGWWVSAARCALVSAVGELSPWPRLLLPTLLSPVPQAEQAFGTSRDLWRVYREEEREGGVYHCCFWELGLWPTAGLSQQKLGLFWSYCCVLFEFVL